MNLRKNAPADGVVVDEAAASAGRKRLLVAGGLAAALALVAAMGYVFLTGGDDAAETGVVASGPRVQGTATPLPTGTATSAPPIKKFNGKNARDPFKPLVVEQVASTASPSTGTTGGSTGTTGGSTGTTGGSTGTTGGTAGTTGDSTTPRSTSPVTIKLVTVNASDTSATFLLDQKQYAGVEPMKTFGRYFKLLNLRQGKCGAVQYGDVTFDLCEGQSLTLR